MIPRKENYSEEGVCNCCKCGYMSCAKCEKNVKECCKGSVDFTRYTFGGNTYAN